MAHGPGDTKHAARSAGAAADASGAADARPAGRVATGRFAGRGGGTATAGSARDAGAVESERDRGTRVANALRVAEGGEPDTDGDDTDWRAVGLFGAGVAIGTLLGAGLALLLAPSSGFETRMRLARSARQTRDRLSTGARRGSRELQRNVTRKLTRGRWAAEDAIQRRRHRLD